MKELEAYSDYELLALIVRERKESTTNVYSPLNERLNKLLKKLENKQELTNWNTVLP